MEDNINTCSSSSAYNHILNPNHPSSSDEISLFLGQLLVRSSSSPSSTAMAHTGPQGQPRFSSPPSISRSNVAIRSISAVDLSDRASSRSGMGFAPSGACFSGLARGTGANLSSSSFGASENETDEYDYESEEGLEALVDEAPAKVAATRGSSKRSRAAEVHNLSEKRRRSRINEKMKALQNLIPNSNKTDKASMLDEAIEYLKQLQLQVQMLSMRNGLSLHPMCLPGVLQPMQLSRTGMGFGEENESLHMNMTITLPENQETSAQTVFSLPNQCASSNQVTVPNMLDIINSETSFGLESTIQSHFGPFQLLNSSEEICKEDMLPHHQLNSSHSKMNTSEFEAGCVMQRDQLEGVLLKNIEHNHTVPAIDWNANRKKYTQ